MTTVLDVFLPALLVLIAPVFVYALLTGSKHPEGSPLAKYYEAEKYLGASGNLMLLALCVENAFKLAFHFKLLHVADKDTVSAIVGAPFMILVIAHLTFWFRAWRKVKSTANGATHS